MLIICQIPYVRRSNLACGVFESNQPQIPVVASVGHLVLSLNTIESIPPPPNPGGASDALALGGLTHIKSLTLSSNSIRSWSDINALAKHCPILETLNITSNPITEGQSPHIF
jgi:Leucine-rich repeat (LRR) protein